MPDLGDVTELRELIAVGMGGVRQLRDAIAELQDAEARQLLLEAVMLLASTAAAQQLRDVLPPSR